MKLFLMVIGLFLFLLSPALAADVRLDWDAVINATGYKLAVSYDMGATWSTPIDAGATKPFTFTGVPEDRLVLFKVAAYNTAETVWCNYRFAAIDFRKKPLTQPSGLGVQE